MRAPAVLRVLDPLTHPAYATAARELDDSMRALVARRASTPEDATGAIAALDAEIVGRAYWYVLRPDEIAREIIGLRRRISVAEATRILLACGEAGYDIAGNGGPDHALRYPGRHGYPEYAPTRGAERDEVLWAAAEWWAHFATRPITYISLGDHRGYLPRPVQYDQPGSMHPRQRAALTIGPEPDVYMRQHTRRLLVVEP